jgi:hypothetical protein
VSWTTTTQERPPLRLATWSDGREGVEHTARRQSPRGT